MDGVVAASTNDRESGVISNEIIVTARNSRITRVKLDRILAAAGNRGSRGGGLDGILLASPNTRVRAARRISAASADCGSLAASGAADTARDGRALTRCTVGLAATGA